MNYSQAAAYTKDEREQILETFTELPSTVRHAQDDRANFSSDWELRNYVIQLYLSILSVSDKMIEWLIDTSIWQRIKAL